MSKEKIKFPVSFKTYSRKNPQGGRVYYFAVTDVEDYILDILKERDSLKEQLEELKKQSRIRELKSKVSESKLIECGALLSSTIDLNKNEQNKALEINEKLKSQLSSLKEQADKLEVAKLLLIGHGWTEEKLNHTLSTYKQSKGE